MVGQTGKVIYRGCFANSQVLKETQQGFPGAEFCKFLRFPADICRIPPHPPLFSFGKSVLIRFILLKSGGHPRIPLRISSAQILQKPPVDIRRISDGSSLLLQRISADLIRFILIKSGGHPRFSSARIYKVRPLVIDITFHKPAGAMSTQPISQFI